MLAEDLSDQSDIGLDESSQEDQSDEIFPEAYYGMEGTISNLMTDAHPLVIENIVDNPTDSDVFYFRKTREYLLDGLIADNYGTLFLERAFSIDTSQGNPDKTAAVDAYLEKKYHNLPKTTGFCRKYLKKSMGFGYVCVDCMSHNRNSFVCADCFKHSNHEGHKVFKLISSGVCDCGDFDNDRFPNANCSKHRGDIPEDNITTEEEKVHFLHEIQSFLLVQYSLLNLFDFSRKPIIGTVIIEEVLHKLKELTTKYPALVNLVSSALMVNLERIESFKLLRSKKVANFPEAKCLIHHPTQVKLTPEESELKTNQADPKPAQEAQAEDPQQQNTTAEVGVEPMIEERTTATEQPVSGWETGMQAETPVQVVQGEPEQKFSCLDLVFSECLQLHVSHAKKLVELVVHFSTVPEFKAFASVSWVSHLPALFSPSLCDDIDGSDKFISPLFDLCDQFLVDGRSLQELFERQPPVNWIHLMARIWEKLLKISDNNVVLQFLDKRLWEDFLIDVLDSILANKAWNSVILQNERFVQTMVRFFINCYHCSLSLPLTRPADEVVSMIGYVAHQAMDYQAICLTFFGKMVSRLIIHPQTTRTKILSNFKKVLHDELILYRKYRCGVLVPKAGTDLSLYRLMTLLNCAQHFFEAQLTSTTNLSEVKIVPAFKSHLQIVEDGLMKGEFFLPPVNIHEEKQLSQLLFVESSRVFGFSKQLAHNVWSFMGETSEMIQHEYVHKCLDTIDRLSLQLCSTSLTPAFVFYCMASRVLLPPVMKQSGDPNKPVDYAKEPVSIQIQSNTRAKPDIPVAGQKLTILHRLRMRSEGSTLEGNLPEDSDPKNSEWISIPSELEDLVFTKQETIFGVHEFETFFWYYDSVFKSSEWHKKISNQTKAMLLSEYFNSLYLIYTDEYAVSFVCEALLTEIKDSIKDRDASGDKFYMEFLKKELAGIILALSPIAVPDLLEEAQFLAPEKETLEAFIEELCEIDTENHFIRLKKRVRETLVERLDLSCAGYKSDTHSKLVEGWTTKVDKKYHDKLRLRDMSVASPFTKYLRYKLGSAWPWEIYIATVEMCRLVPDWKKVVGPLSAMLKFVLQYLEVFGQITLQTRDPLRKLAFNWFVEHFVKYLEGEVKSSPILKSFKQKLVDLTQRYFTFGEANVVDIAAKAEADEQEMVEEHQQNQNQSKIDQELKSKFESRKKAIFSKMRQKQSQFVNQLDNSSFEERSSTNLEKKGELECAVTKERISPTEVYYLHTQLHFTNLVSESMRNSLSLMAQNTDHHDAEDIQLALSVIDRTESERYLLEDLVVSCCGHIIKSRENASRSMVEIYDPIERPCAICKKPTNLMLPVHPTDLWYRLRLEKQSLISSPQKRDLISTLEGFANSLKEMNGQFAKLHKNSLKESATSMNISHQNGDDYLGEHKHLDLPPSSLGDTLQCEWSTFSKDDVVSTCKGISTAATTEILDFYKHFVSVRSKIVDDILNQAGPAITQRYSEIDWSWGNPDIAPIYQVTPLAIACWVFTSNVRYMELRGFTQTARNFGTVLHNLYLNVKLCSLNDATTLPKRVSIFLEYINKLNNHNVVERSKYEILLLTLLPTFVNSEKEDMLFHQMLKYLVDLQMQVHTEAEEMQTKWEDLRYSQKGTAFINSLLRLLRAAALIKYASKFPVYQSSSGRIFDKLLQYNSIGDSRELDYLFLFLELEPPNTAEDALARMKSFTQIFADPESSHMQEPKAGHSPNLKLETRLVGGIPNYIFSLVRLPSQLRILYNQYLFEPCDKCNWRRALMACLLCGAKWCQKRCHPASEHKKLVTCGNATTHSMLHHNGTAALIDCGSGHILLVEGNRVTVFSDIYKDKFGFVSHAGFNDPNNPLEKFTLSRDRIAELKTALLNQEVVQTVVLKSMADDVIFHRNFV